MTLRGKDDEVFSVCTLMWKYDLPYDVRIDGTLASKAYRLFMLINEHTLLPVSSAKRQALMHEMYVGQFKILEYFVVAIMGIILTRAFDPAASSYVVYGVGFGVFIGDFLVRLQWTRKRFNSLPVEIGEEGTETFYRVLMAQLLGRKFVNVRGVIYRV